MGHPSIKNPITKIKYYPNLLGYVQTKAKSQANTELLAKNVETDDPVLAHWKYGQGRSVAFTSDVTGRWTRQWMAWPKFRQFWSDIFSYLLSGTNAKVFSDFNFTYYVKGRDLKLELTIYQSGYGSKDFPSELIYQDGTVQSVFFTEKTPGRFLVNVEAQQSGMVSFKLSTPDKKIHEFAIEIPSIDKLEKPAGINRSFLQQLASLSGGKVNPTAADLKQGSKLELKSTDLSRWFLLLGLLLILLEIIYRERSRVS